MGNYIIETEQLALRELTMDDLQSLHQILSDQETMRDIHSDGNLFPEIGYHIDKRFWCKGYASQAAKACLRYAFENTDNNEIFCYQGSIINSILAYVSG